MNVMHEKNNFRVNGQIVLEKYFGARRRKYEHGLKGFKKKKSETKLRKILKTWNEFQHKYISKLQITYF